MEYIIGILGLVGVGFLLSKFGREKAWTIYKEKDVKLAADQEVKENELDAMEKTMASLEMRLKGKTPKEIEDYWNDKDNS